MQMVGLYNDPKGERIFSKSGTDHMNNSVVASMTRSTKNSSGEVETLRKRVKELESLLEKKVCTKMHMFTGLFVSGPLLPTTNFHQPLMISIIHMCLMTVTTITKCNDPY